MTILLLIGFFMSLFLFALLLGKRNKAIVDKVLLSMFAVYALTIGGTYMELYNVQNDYPYPHLMNISWLFLLVHGPLLWFYVKSLTTPEFTIKPIHFLHFAPFVLYVIFHSFNFISLSAEEKVMYVKGSERAAPLFAKIGSMLIGFSTVGYNIIALFLLKKHLRDIKNSYSNIEDKDLQWLKTLVIASLVIFSINVMLFNLNNYFHFSGNFALSQIAYSFSTFYVFYIGYFGIRQGRIFVDSVKVETEPKNITGKKAESIFVEKKDHSDIINKLTLLMEDEQPHLDPEITLSKLSVLLKVKPETLSEVLNASLNQNFFDYINKYRIDEFKLKCLGKENKHLSVMGIAYDSGFNSKAAFYRAFNKFEGISPTAYIAKVS
jgi:AraC-like DNA-binding protein